MADLQALVPPHVGAPATITLGAPLRGLGGVTEPVTFTVKDPNGNAVGNSNVIVTVTVTVQSDGGLTLPTWHYGKVSDNIFGIFGASATVTTNPYGVATVYFRPGANISTERGNSFQMLSRIPGENK
jgi:hypothetical protein